jgi:hypothetical protein
MSRAAPRPRPGGFLFGSGDVRPGRRTLQTYMRSPHADIEAPPGKDARGCELPECKLCEPAGRGRLRAAKRPQAALKIAIPARTAIHEAATMAAGRMARRESLLEPQDAASPPRGTTCAPSRAHPARRMRAPCQTCRASCPSCRATGASPRRSNCAATPRPAARPSTFGAPNSSAASCRLPQGRSNDQRGGHMRPCGPPDCANPAASCRLQQGAGGPLAAPGVRARLASMRAERDAHAGPHAPTLKHPRARTPGGASCPNASCASPQDAGVSQVGSAVRTVSPQAAPWIALLARTALCQAATMAAGRMARRESLLEPQDAASMGPEPGPGAFLGTDA